MKLKNVLAAVVAGTMVVPAMSFANHTGANCNYAATQDQHQSAGPATVYADNNGRNAGTSGTADEAAGVCTAQGTVEVGHSATKGSKRSEWYGQCVSTVRCLNDGAYIVADGGSANPDPADGYVGVSNYETSATPCPAPDQCTGSNSGGQVGAPGGPYAPVYVPVMCGNTTGPSWDSSQRDGCETS